MPAPTIPILNPRINKGQKKAMFIIDVTIVIHAYSIVRPSPIRNPV